jgi:hypothetical protein
MLLISVHMINIATYSQIMHNVVVLFIYIFCSSSPRHVSASDYAIIKAAISKLHKKCRNVNIKC